MKLLSLFIGRQSTSVLRYIHTRIRRSRVFSYSSYSSLIWLSTSRGDRSFLPKNVSKRVGASKRQKAPKIKDVERLTLDCNQPPIEGPRLKPMLHVTE